MDERRKCGGAGHRIRQPHIERICADQPATPTSMKIVIAVMTSGMGGSDGGRSSKDLAKRREPPMYQKMRKPHQKAEIARGW